MNKPILISRKTKIGLLLFSVLLLFPYAMLFLYAHPMGEDFSEAMYSRQNGILNASMAYYTHWNGRYFSNLALMISPLVYDSFKVYRLELFLFFLLLIISIYTFSIVLFKNSIGKLSALSISLVWMLLYLSVTPSISEQFYWYSGDIGYLLPLILFMFYASILFPLFEKGIAFPKLMHSVVSILLIAAITGSNETMAMMILCLQVFLLALGFRYNLPQKKFLLILLFASLICSGFVILSPGNAFRSAYFPGHHQLFFSLKMTFLQMLRFTAKWGFSFPMILASLLFIPFSALLGKKIKAIGSFIYPYPFMLVFCSALMLFCFIFPAYWSMGMMGQYRTINEACFFFIPLWFLSIGSFVSFTGLNRKIESLEISAPVLIRGAVIFFFSLLITGNTYRALDDLWSGEAKKFDEEMEHRYLIFKEASGTAARIAEMPSLKSHPKCLLTLENNPSNKTNVMADYAVYFNLKKIKPAE